MSLRDGNIAFGITCCLMFALAGVGWLLLVNTGVDSFAYREALKENSVPVLAVLVTWDYVTNRAGVFSPATCVPEHDFASCFPRSEETFKRVVASQCFAPACFTPRDLRFLRSQYNIQGYTREPIFVLPSPVPPQPPSLSIEEVRTRITRRSIRAGVRNRKSRLRRHLFEMIDVALWPAFVISETVFDFLES